MFCVFPAKHDLCGLLASACSKPNTILPFDGRKTKFLKALRGLFYNKPNDSSWGWGDIGGPNAFTKALQYFDLVNFGKPFTYFYPIHLSAWKEIFNDTLSQDLNLFSNSYSIHLWNEMTRKQNGFNKNASFSKHSLIEHYKRKYLS